MTLVFFSITLLAFSQPTKEYSMVSLMNGQGDFVTDSNTIVTLPVWGYGWTQPNPFVILPGPTVYAKEGDSVHLEMLNPSMEGHTIHLHGLDVDQANDGVPHTSDFIQQGESFTYRFKATHAGNFLYHCHVTTTMHLALGMYGMVIVYPADSSNRVYTDGPEYDVQYEYLFSDMDARWNADYTAIGGFLTYDPDLYLINGKNKHLLYADSNVHILGGIGQQHLMRFLNVGYRVNRVIFPPELNAVVHTSDGRVLEPFEVDTLTLYPGERYSVLAEVLDTAASFVSVDYLDPYRLRFLGREYIPVNDEDFEFIPTVLNDTLSDTIGLGIEEEAAPDVLLFPNPANSELFISSTHPYTQVKIFDHVGRQVLEEDLSVGTSRLILPEMPAALYFVRISDGRGLTVTKRLVNRN